MLALVGPVSLKLESQQRGSGQERRRRRRNVRTKRGLSSLSLSRTTAAHETRHSSTVSTRRLPIQVVVIAPAENRNSFHGHRRKVSKFRRRETRPQTHSLSLGSFERSGERALPLTSKSQSSRVPNSGFFITLHSALPSPLSIVVTAIDVSIPTSAPFTPRTPTT